MKSVLKRLSLALLSQWPSARSHFGGSVAIAQDANNANGIRVSPVRTDLTVTRVKQRQLQ